MKALIQRVSQASVSVQQQVIGNIGPGLLVFLGIEQHDTEEQIERLAHKVCHYRVFADDAGKMNLSVLQYGGKLLVVSQFTLAADTQSGLRPSFTPAALPDKAEIFYQRFIQYCRQLNIDVHSGEFGADMQISLVNDGPVTFLLQN